jgi:6-pyruvoyltetrahydropterin/6-carboxytetrahydropterin synthase
MFTITQKFSFCYGHRLLGHSGKCRRLHGHTAVAEVLLRFSALQDTGMAMDFFEIKAGLGAWIDAELDHQLLLHESDPICGVLEKEGEVFRKMPFHPTAENIAKAIFEAARRMELPVSAVTLWESDKSAATYSA